MTTYPREEIEEMMRRWLAANVEAEKIGDWRILDRFYAQDATYGWNYGPKGDFMAVGREEIRELALGQEMAGLDGWRYPYEKTVIDDTSGDVVCFWRQLFDKTDPDTGEDYEVYGIGGSWFKYGGDYEWSWQRDFFDFGNVSDLFVRMIANNDLSDGMLARINNSSGRQPGWYKLRQAPVKIW